MAAKAASSSTSKTRGLSRFDMLIFLMRPIPRIKEIVKSFYAAFIGILPFRIRLD
jgi:hypothetical protein